MGFFSWSNAAYLAVLQWCKEAILNFYVSVEIECNAVLRKMCNKEKRMNPGILRCDETREQSQEINDAVVMEVMM